MKNYLFILLFLNIGFNSFCQGKKNLPNTDNKFAFEVSGYGSKILKHTTKFIPKITEPSYGFELSASYKTFGTKNWQRALNYPEIGVSYVQSHFGNRDIFGSSYGILPYAKFYISRSKVVDFHAKLGGGLAYITKPYDIKTNPTNNVIGSKINTLVQFRLGLDFHLTKEVDLMLAGSFMHYSNSSTQAPNLGINIPSGNIGVIYKPKHFETEYIKEQDKTIFQKKNEYAFKFGLGMREKNPRGAKFPTYSLALQYGRYFGYANKLLAGVLVSFDQYEYDFMIVQEIDEDKNQVFRSIDWSAYLGYEMMLGNVGLSFIVGAYVYDPGFTGAPIWAKPGVTYYFPGFGKQKHTPFLGVNMKTHYFTAQYVEMNFGIAF